MFMKNVGISLISFHEHGICREKNVHVICDNESRDEWVPCRVSKAFKRAGTFVIVKEAFHPLKASLIDPAFSGCLLSANILLTQPVSKRNPSHRNCKGIDTERKGFRRQPMYTSPFVPNSDRLASDLLKLIGNYSDHIVCLSGFWERHWLRKWWQNRLRTKRSTGSKSVDIENFLKASSIIV